MDILLPKYIKYQLYLLQLENYEVGRYWKLLASRGFFPGRRRPLRKDLVWTTKAKALMLMASTLHFLLAVFVAAVLLYMFFAGGGLLWLLLATFIFGLPFYFVWFSAALVVISPLDSYAKNKLAREARAKLAGLKELKIIGVAGSYGKTTMKEVLTQVLSIKYKVSSPAESINTPVGIARFILNKLGDDTKILILELGEHYRGDIKQLCDIAQPDVAVITGINEAHLERMNTLENIAATIFEAAEFAKPEAMVVMNGDDARVVNRYRGFTGGREVRFYSSGSGHLDYDVSNQKFDQQGLAWSFEVKDRGTFSIGLIAKYGIGASVAALAVAEHLGMNDTDIKIGLSQVRPVEHRLQPIRSGNNILVIDDSYNGNPAGAAEAIKVLSRFTDRRKIYITPGLVETGAAAAEVHREIGRSLAGVADVVILIKDSVTPEIELGIRNYESGGKKPEVMWFDTALDMHQSLKNIVKPGDVVVFQNDWGDQYI